MEYATKRRTEKTKECKMWQKLEEKNQIQEKFTQKDFAIRDSEIAPSTSILHFNVGVFLVTTSITIIPVKRVHSMNTLSQMLTDHEGVM